MLNYQPAPIDLLFQALSDPTRRLMVERLAQGPLSVSSLADPFEMSLPAIVQHLKVLEASGLVRTEKIGRVRTCSVETAGLQAVERWINDRRRMWERKFDQLGDYLDSLPDDPEEGPTT